MTVKGDFKVTVILNLFQDLSFMNSELFGFWVDFLYREMIYPTQPKVVGFHSSLLDSNLISFNSSKL